MKKTKLVKLLGTFSRSEIKQFRNFVKSPFYNTNKNVTSLNEALIKFHPCYNSELLTEEHIYLKVFGPGKFDYFKIKNISSDLYNLALDYLRLLSNPATEFTGDYNLIVQLRQRKLFSLHKKMVSTVNDDFKKKEHKGSEFLYDNLLLTKENQLVDLFEKPSSITGILSEFESFYEYLLFHLLQYYNLLIHIGKENNVKIDIKMIDEVVRYLEKKEVSSHPTTTAYQYLILLKIKGKEEHYFTVKQHYFKNYDKMDAHASFRIHLHIIGYCADMFNFKGDRRFVNEAHELFKHSYLNNRVTSGELLYPDFVNYIKVFSRAGDTALARKFISDYAAKLPEDQYDNCINFSMAYIAHYEGRLIEALRYISKVNFPLAIMKVQVKIMQVQLNFELGYFEETRSFIESFKKTLIREVIVSDDYKNSILSFLKQTISMITIKEETDSKTRQFEANKLIDTLNKKQLNHFGIKFWLLDRASEVLNHSNQKQKRS